MRTSDLSPLPRIATTGKHKVFQNHLKMTWTSQRQAARPAPCCRTLQSFTLSHETFVSSTPHRRGGGSYSLPSITTSVLVCNSWLQIHHRQGLFAAETIWPIYSYTCQLWNYPQTIAPLCCQLFTPHHPWRSPEPVVIFPLLTHK